MSDFTKEERVIIAKKAKDYAEQISLNTAQLHIGKSCYIKGYTDAIEQANEANKQPDTKALRLQNVMPRFIPENLIIKSGVHTIRVDVFNDHRKQPACRITCIDDMTETEDLDGNWIEEYEDGCFYANNEQIDQIIKKLQEAKTFLNGA
ncbi:MAG: hypothetical protein HN704_18040 [Bacteroidetes bacterium]|jgi:hypothetical protein|nr:hypothetical protein [Bacteroidota bacterium]